MPFNYLVPTPPYCPVPNAGNGQWQQQKGANRECITPKEHRCIRQGIFGSGLIDCGLTGHNQQSHRRPVKAESYLSG
jgi:hypothetical protein